MNWKENYDTTFKHSQFIDHSKIKDFISTQIIEKLIADIPDYYITEDGFKLQIDITHAKQQLRDKWLK